MAINTEDIVNNSNNLIVYLKSMARSEAFPIDRTEIWYSLGEKDNKGKYPPNSANGYATENPLSYVGQTIKVVENGLVSAYIIADENGTLLKLADAETMNTALESKLNIADIEAIPDSEILALFST